MRNMMKIYILGQAIMVVGSVMYLVELFTTETPALTLAITVIYIVSLVLMLIGWLGTKEERAAEKERRKQEAEEKKAAKRAARQAA